MIVSCDNNKVKSPTIIPLASTVGKYNILNLSDIASEIKYIPIETKDSVLITPRIINIMYENEKILILDISSAIKNSCYLFDINGKFCCKIGQWGQGPDDYLQINDVSIHENLIYLMAWHKILVYDTSGRLVENINLQTNNVPIVYRESDLRRIFPLKKGTFVVSVVTGKGDYPTAFLFETNHSTVKTVKEYPNYIPLDKIKGGYSGDELGRMYRIKDDVRIFNAIKDTIFTIGQNSEMKEAFTIDLGKYKIPLPFHEWKIVDFEHRREYRMNYITTDRISESLNHLFIKFYFGNHAPEPFETTDPAVGSQYIKYDVYGVFDKYRGELTLLKQPIKGKLGFKNDVDNGPVIWPYYISSNNELVTYISPEEFMDYYEKIENPTPQMTEIAKNLKIDDNPIVIIAKLLE